MLDPGNVPRQAGSLERIIGMERYIYVVFLVVFVGGLIAALVYSPLMALYFALFVAGSIAVALCLMAIGGGGSAPATHGHGGHHH
jgi:cyanate permease